VETLAFESAARLTKVKTRKRRSKV
jgi:hypothetical protein